MISNIFVLKRRYSDLSAKNFRPNLVCLQNRRRSVEGAVTKSAEIQAKCFPAYPLALNHALKVANIID